MNFEILRQEGLETPKKSISIAGFLENYFSKHLTTNRDAFLSRFISEQARSLRNKSVRPRLESLKIFVKGCLVKWPWRGRVVCRAGVLPFPCRAIFMAEL